jgi:hypothetical protein
VIRAIQRFLAAQQPVDENIEKIRRQVRSLQELTVIVDDALARTQAVLRDEAQA